MMITYTHTVETMSSMAWKETTISKVAKEVTLSGEALVTTRSMEDTMMKTKATIGFTVEQEMISSGITTD